MSGLPNLTPDSDGLEPLQSYLGQDLDSGETGVGVLGSILARA